MEKIELPMGFVAPFHVWVDKDDEVHITDAEDGHLMSFNTITQLPLDDEAALEEEKRGWVMMADFIVRAMNAQALREQI